MGTGGSGRRARDDHRLHQRFRDDGLLMRLIGLAEQCGSRIRIPGGAIGGMEALASAAMAYRRRQSNSSCSILWQRGYGYRHHHMRSAWRRPDELPSVSPMLVVGIEHRMVTTTPARVLVPRLDRICQGLTGRSDLISSDLTQWQHERARRRPTT
jgi:hypothetical protein